MHRAGLLGPVFLAGQLMTYTLQVIYLFNYFAPGFLLHSPSRYMWHLVLGELHFLWAWSCNAQGAGMGGSGHPLLHAGQPSWVGWRASRVLDPEACIP